MYVYPNTEARSCNHHCSGKVISITHSECVSVTLDTQHEMRMRYIVIYGFSASLYFSTLFHKRRILRGKKVTVHKMWVLIFSEILSEIFLILNRTERDVI